MPRSILLTLVLGLSLVTAGCPLRWQRVTLNQPIKAVDVTFIVPGHTTFAEILHQLGVPDQLEDSEVGAIAQYDFMDAKEFKVDLLWWLPFVVPAAAVVPGSARSVNLQGGGVGTDHFRVFFDSKWIAQYYAFEIHSGATEFMLWPFQD